MEIWKDVVGLEDYAQVSSLGRVKTKDRYVNHINGSKRLIRGKLKKGTDNGLGYLQYRFSINNKTIRKYGHVMVAEAFLHRDKSKKLEVNHKDGDKSNNKLSNLEWLVHKDNISHAIAIGLIIPPKTKTYTKVCPLCGDRFEADRDRRIYCSRVCSSTIRRKVTRPSREELIGLITTKSFLAIGRVYGVSDNAVRRWCKAYDIPYHTIKRHQTTERRYRG